MNRIMKSPVFHTLLVAALVNGGMVYAGSRWIRANANEVANAAKAAHLSHLTNVAKIADVVASVPLPPPPPVEVQKPIVIEVLKAVNEAPVSVTGTTPASVAKFMLKVMDSSLKLGLSIFAFTQLRQPQMRRQRIW